MKNLKLLPVLCIASLLFIACSNDDDATPLPVNEEEVITTLRVTLTPINGGTEIILETRDLDGDGPNAPLVTVSGNLSANNNYRGKILLLNETVNPPENITEEVIEEAEEHQFFFTIAGGLDVSTTYIDFDSNLNALGTEFTLDTRGPSSGTITFTLRHEPTKPNTGLADAGGETDVAATFNVIVE